MNVLTAIPVYNEERHLENVLGRVQQWAPHILVVNDGSTDRTGELLERIMAQQRGGSAHPASEEVPTGGNYASNITVITHSQNRGYGAALMSSFAYMLECGADILVTMDCDGQHEPARIPVLLEAIHDVEIVSGSRYLRDFRQDTIPPEDRRYINRIITSELNERFGLQLTDAFCGFKAYRRTALARLHITETGWGMPLQLWVQAACAGLRIKEVAVPRVYLDPNRAFGGVLDDADARLAYYRRVIERAIDECARLRGDGRAPVHCQVHAWEQGTEVCR